MATNTDSSIPLLHPPPSHTASLHPSNGTDTMLPTSPAGVSVTTSTISTTPPQAISDMDTPSNHKVELHSASAKSQNLTLPRGQYEPRLQKESIWFILARACRVRLFASLLQVRWKHHSLQKEPKKAITERSRLRFLVRFLVHLPPLTGSITLLVLNIHGYFIGSGYSGPNINPAIDAYALQLTAKLMVCFVSCKKLSVYLD